MKNRLAPHPLQLHAEHPQRQHVEQDVKNPSVQEHVGDGLPDLQAPDDIGRTQPEAQRDRGHDHGDKKGGDVRYDRALIAGVRGPGPKEYAKVEEER